MGLPGEWPRAQQLPRGQELGPRARDSAGRARPAPRPGGVVHAGLRASSRALQKSGSWACRGAPPAPWTVGFREVETTRCPPPSFCGRPRLLQTFSCRPGTPNLTRPKRHVHVLSSTPFYALSSPEFCLVVDNSVAMSIENNARSLVLRAVYGVRTLLSANTRLPENPLSTLLHTLKHKGVLEVIYRRILLARII